MNTDNRDDIDPVSKSQRKRDAEAIREFAARLVSESPQRLKRLSLTDQMRQAIADCPPPSTRGAYKRHIQYLGKLIRKTGDFQTLLQQIDQPKNPPSQHSAFCDQLINAFTDHAETLRTHYPHVSLQQARQLARRAASMPAPEDSENNEEKTHAAKIKADKARLSLLKLLSGSSNSNSA